MGPWGIGVIISITILPWVLWTVLRRAWLSRRERKVLATKYGDLEMFRDRMQEWNVGRKAR